MLRICLILIRIRILNLHWKKMDPDQNPDPGYFLKIYWIFLTKQNFKICLIFLLIFMLNEPFRNQEIFSISLFSIVQIWVLRVKLKKKSFWLIFCPLDPDTWIRIFLRIRIQEAKILRIQWIRIRILSTDFKGTVVNLVYVIFAWSVPWNYASSPFKFKWFVFPVQNKI